jgi:hypothetical protein
VTAVDVDVRRALDLVLGVGQLEPVARERGAGDRDEGLAGAEEAGVDGHELRTTALVVEEDLTDLADLVPVAAVRRGSHDAASVLGVKHVASCWW